jgi:hypothetical protein
MSKSNSAKNGNGILSGEIRSLQALAKRVAEKGDDPSVGLADLLKIVEFHGRACTRLATLLRAERDLDDTPSTNDLLEQAIQEVLQEMQAEDAPQVDKASQTPAGSGNLEVLIEAPDAARVALRINDRKETVPLEGGRGVNRLGTDRLGRFEISPADRTQYCAAGEALLVGDVKEVKEVRAKFSYP